MMGPRTRPSIERLEPGIVYARVPSMNPQVYAAFDSLTIPDRQPDDRVLIVDMRDNDGGSIDYGLRVLSGWIDASQGRSFYDRLGWEVNESCLYAPLKWGFGSRFVSTNNGSVPQSDRSWLSSLLADIAREPEADCPRRVRKQPASWRYTDRRFAPDSSVLRIVALVNAGCGSDCELLTAYLASLPQTIVAGVNTAGVGQFTQPGYSVLPRTGLRYRIALGMSDIYGDDRSFDGYGLDVDLLIEDVDKMDRSAMLSLARLAARLPGHPR
jgi:C-terminal processing protease CtpA/Prc